MPLQSAGLLLFRIRKGEPEFFLVHPGGPFFTKKDKGWWSIPKGLPEKDEALEDAARREFKEETGYELKGESIPLGSIKQKGGKTVHAWAMEGDMPEGWILKCNTFLLAWPPKSGNRQNFPEVDEGRFFSRKDALQYINEAQGEFINRLMYILKENKKIK